MGRLDCGDKHFLKNDGGSCYTTCLYSMDTKTILSAFLFLGLTAHVSAQIYIPNHKHVNIGLVYPVSNNGMQAKAYTNCFSLNLLAGFSGGETGVSLAG